MSSGVEAREPSARYLSSLQSPLVQHFELMATAPGGVAKLRELILTLAVQGKLVTQDVQDEPASELLKKIRTEKDRLIAEGKMKRDKPPTAITDEEIPYRLPLGWEWSNLSTIGVINPRNEASDWTIASFVQMSSIPVAFSEQHISEPRPWRDIKSGFTQFAEGDVGVAKITPCFENGKSTVFQGLSNGIGAGTTELHIVRPLGGVKPRYVLLFLKTPAFLKNGEVVMTGSAGQKRMPRAYFENTPFPLPPLSEQSRIVTRVEELMRLCDALEAKGQLEAAQHVQLVQTLLGALTASTTPDELVDNWQRVAIHFDSLLDRPQAIDALEQTILQLAVRGLLVPQDPNDEPASELLKKIRAEKKQPLAKSNIKQSESFSEIKEAEWPFNLPCGWIWVRMGDLIEGGSGTTPLRARTDYFEAGTEMWVKTTDLNNAVVTSCEELITKTAVVENRLKYFPAGTVCVAMYGGAGTIGKSGVLGVPSTINQSVFALPPAEGVDSDFLHTYVISVRSKWMSFAAGLRKDPNINGHIIKRMVMPLPPLAEQRRIVARVESLRGLCADLRQRLAASQTTQAHLAEALIDEVN